MGCRGSNDIVRSQQKENDLEASNYVLDLGALICRICRTTLNRRLLDLNGMTSIRRCILANLVTQKPTNLSLERLKSIIVLGSLGHPQQESLPETSALLSNRNKSCKCKEGPATYQVRCQQFTPPACKTHCRKTYLAYGLQLDPSSVSIRIELINFRFRPKHILLVYSNSRCMNIALNSSNATFKGRSLLQIC